MLKGETLYIVSTLLLVILNDIIKIFIERMKEAYK